MAERKYRNPQVNLRLPEELKEQIAKLAEKNGRSANAEMVMAIEHWVSIKDQVEDNSQAAINRKQLTAIIEAVTAVINKSDTTSRTTLLTGPIEELNQANKE